MDGLRMLWDLKSMNAIELSIFASRLESVCDEMGSALQRAAFSPNIKDRLDFSCAVFDSDGELCAQAAHIPVHLGSMAFAMRDIVACRQWQQGDMVVLNDPYMGGTHLPDVTLVAPLFVADELLGFVANRAHHANIGGNTPGSMPVSSSLDQEGIVIPPTLLVEDGEIQHAVLSLITGTSYIEPSKGDCLDDPVMGDFVAQISVNRVGLSRLTLLINELGVNEYLVGLTELNHYGERIARSAINDIPNGEYHFVDVLDDDGMGTKDIPIEVVIRIDDYKVDVNFAGTAKQVSGNVNCPLSVAAAAVLYVFRCLMPAYTPACAGTFRLIHLDAPKGCLLNATRPAAVAAGNVETSTRVVDVILGALTQAIPELIPAASHGSMNNVAMGHLATEKNPRWDYYETIAGGMGAHADGYGLSAVQTHMTNTLNTPIESLESHYPIRITRYQIRDASGGEGLHCGGNGLIREFEFLQSTEVSLLTERRSQKPWGANKGEAAKSGENLLNGKPLPAKISFHTESGDRLTIKTPGGGGWGATT